MSDRHLKLIERIKRDYTRRHVTAEQLERLERIKDSVGGVALMLAEICPESRELNIAFRKLEEASMWAGVAIVRNEG